MSKKNNTLVSLQRGTQERFPFRPDKPFQNQILRIGLALSFILGTPIFGTILIILPILGQDNTISLETRIGVTLSFLVFTYSAFFAANAGIVTLADIVLESKGIRLCLLGPWSTLIPWESLQEMSIVKVNVFPLYEGGGLLRKRKTFFAIHIPGLTLSYMFVSFYYRLGPRPVFLITPEHERYRLLVEQLRQAALEQGCDPERLAL